MKIPLIHRLLLSGAALAGWACFAIVTATMPAFALEKSLEPGLEASLSKLEKLDHALFQPIQDVPTAPVAVAPLEASAPDQGQTGSSLDQQQSSVQAVPQTQTDISLAQYVAASQPTLQSSRQQALAQKLVGTTTASQVSDIRDRTESTDSTQRIGSASRPDSRYQYRRSTQFRE